MEHHGNIAVFGIHHGDVLVPNEDTAGVDEFKAGQHAQRGGFATAGGADEHQEFAVVNIQTEVVDAGFSSSRVDTGGVIEGHRCHVP